MDFGKSLRSLRAHLAGDCLGRFGRIFSTRCHGCVTAVSRLRTRTKPARTLNCHGVTFQNPPVKEDESAETRERQREGKKTGERKERGKGKAMEWAGILAYQSLSLCYISGTSLLHVT